MKYTFYALAALSLLLMLLGATQLWNYWDGSTGTLPPDGGDLMGMEDRGLNNPAYQQLKQKFAAKIEFYRQAAGRYKNFGLLAGFLVTGLAGISTLISTVQAGKTQTQVPRRVVTAVAILTFLTTLVNWAHTHLNEERTTAQQNFQKVREVRLEFSIRYQKETDQRDNLIEQYAEMLDGL